MRIITTEEVDWAHDENKIGLLESCMMFECARRDGFELLSDFSGNIFFKHKGVIKPYNICIPELKNEHDEFEKRLPPITPEVLLQDEQCDFKLPKLSRRKIKNIGKRVGK